MNIIEIVESKLSPFIHKGVFTIVESEVNNMYEQVVLTADKVGFRIIRDLREDDINIVVFIINQGVVPSILDSSSSVNLQFYLQEIFSKQNLVDELFASTNNASDFIEKFSKVLSIDVNKIIDLKMELFESAKAKSKKHFDESVRLFEQQITDGLDD